MDKFSQEKIAPLVRKMDDEEKIDDSVFKGLFENGVSLYEFYSPSVHTIHRERC